MRKVAWGRARAAGIRKDIRSRVGMWWEEKRELGGGFRGGFVGLWRGGRRWSLGSGRGRPLWMRMEWRGPQDSRTETDSWRDGERMEEIFSQERAEMGWL